MILRTAEEVLKPYYKQNKGGLDEWVTWDDAIKAVNSAREEVIREAAEIGDKAFLDEEYPAGKILELLKQNV